MICTASPVDPESIGGWPEHPDPPSLPSPGISVLFILEVIGKLKLIISAYMTRFPIGSMLAKLYRWTPMHWLFLDPCCTHVWRCCINCPQQRASATTLSGPLLQIQELIVYSKALQTSSSSSWFHSSSHWEAMSSVQLTSHSWELLSHGTGLVEPPANRNLVSQRLSQVPSGGSPLDL